MLMSYLHDKFLLLQRNRAQEWALWFMNIFATAERPFLAAVFIEIITMSQETLVGSVRAESSLTSAYRARICFQRSIVASKR